MQYKHVADRWRKEEAPVDPVELLLYRSHLLGSDLGVTNYAGGNTSCKVREVDPVTGEDREVMWIKGSGGDLGSLDGTGLAALDVRRLRALEHAYRGVEGEDEIVPLYPACAVADGPPASIDTPLHGFLDSAHVDHVHPDAVIALATAVDGVELVEAAYGGEVGWLGWQRPGFDLGLRLRDLVQAGPGLRGVVLGGHGLISWGDTAESCYATTIELVERAAAYIEANRREGAAPFGGRARDDLSPEARRAQATRMLPIIRGALSQDLRVVAAFRDDAAVLDFCAGHEAGRLVLEGTSCPDHFLRTKRRALLLDVDAQADPATFATALEASLAAYRTDYAAYYERQAGLESPPMRRSDPVVLLWPGVGMFTLDRSARQARIAGDFFVAAVNAMRGAEEVGRYGGLPEEEAFRVEYWDLEEAKLRRAPAEKPLSRRVALVTGATGGIGRAITRRLADEGACVVAVDLSENEVAAFSDEIGQQAVGIVADITVESSVARAFDDAALAFGGVDIVINCAGITVSRSIEETTAEDFDRLNAVINRGSFLVSRALVRQLAAQGLGGDIIYIASKNAVAASPDNVAYASAKAAQLHQVRSLAAELGERGIRVNAVNPDAVVQGSKIFASGWREDRAAKYGIEPEKLGEYYAGRSLLKREVLPEDVAAAVFVLLSGELSKTTGAVIPVDGGVAAAFLR